MHLHLTEPSSRAFTLDMRLRDIERRLACANDFHVSGRLSDEGFALLSRQLHAEMRRVKGEPEGFPL